MRIYTRRGDRGQTRLADGSVSSKAAQRLECLGAVDELSACIGLACDLMEPRLVSAREAPRLLASLHRMQEHLGQLCADVAAPAGRQRVSARQVNWLEHEIDRWSAQLPRLRAFILPGGGPAGSCLHLARTICRRAERELVRLVESEIVAGPSLAYLNRLSDALFVAARFATKLAGSAHRQTADGKRPNAGRPGPG